MTRRLPIAATVIVLAAVAVMIALGVWQLQRKDMKEAMIARFERSQAMSSAVPWPTDAADYDEALYRHSSFTCERVLDLEAISGRSASGQSGWAHQARCVTARGGEAVVAIGWSKDPRPPRWTGGEVAGFVAPAGESIKLVAAPPQAGLAPLAAPDPNDIPNNHLAYAWQWFFFAATALAVFAFAVRTRWRASVG